MRRLSLPSGTFRAFAHDLTDFATDYLEKLPQRPSYPPNVSGYQTERLFGRRHCFGGDRRRGIRFIARGICTFTPRLPSILRLCFWIWRTSRSFRGICRKRAPPECNGLAISTSGGRH